MIDERMEEQASLYVLGVLSEADRIEFQKAMLADSELKFLVSRLRATTGALAGAVPLTEPPPRLRARILAQIEPTKAVSSPERKLGLAQWLGWSLAGGLAIVCLLFFFAIRHMSDKIKVINELAASLQSQTNNLQQSVLALRETNRLASLKIAMLDSLLADAPKAIAVSLWDNEKQTGVLVAQHLKALPADKDYELWVFDEDQKPVASGVFHIDESGAMRMDFKPVRNVKTAGKFAVTEEIKGGVPLPTANSLLVLASN